MDVSTAFAVVHADDGSRHTVCWEPEDMLIAVDELVAAGITPVVFHRRRAPQVVNNYSGNSSGNVFQAGTIHSG